MIIYFADRKMNILGQASTHLPEGILVVDDKKTEEIDSGVAVLSLSVPYTDITRNQVESWTEVGNYILRKKGDEAEYYTIIESEGDTKKEEIYLYAEDAGLDLINEVVGPYEADQAYPISYYMNQFSYDSGFEIGLNEVSNLTRKLKWEGEQTATSRLISAATQFDRAEISFSFDVQNLNVLHKYINIHKKRGTAETGIELRLNRDINRIITKKSIANLATALVVTGGTREGENTPINLQGYVYDDGDFHVDSGMLKSRKALEKWSRYLSESGPDVGHIVKTYHYDTTSQSELCNRAVGNLKKICNLELNFEVDIGVLPKNVQIGDTINMIDDKGGLYVSARVLKLETSDANQTAKATLGDYLIRDSGISTKLEELANQFSELAKNRTLYTWIAYADRADGMGISLDAAGKPYIGTATNRLTEKPDISDPRVYTWVLVKGEDAILLHINSVNGYTFKNTGVSTILTVTIISGEQRIDTSAKMYKYFGKDATLNWEYKRLKDSNYSPVDPMDSRLLDHGFIFTLNPKDVNVKTIFNCNLDY